MEASLISTKFLEPAEIRHMTEEALESAEQDMGERQRVIGSIEARNLMAAADVMVVELGGDATWPQAQQLLQGVSGLQEALAAGAFGEIEACCDALHRLLGDISRGRAGAPGAMSPG